MLESGEATEDFQKIITDYFCTQNERKTSV
jgi:hypothetical protein